MSDQYVGEIRMFAGAYAPEGWRLCDGTLLPVADPQYQTLFALIGTTYGGDGVKDFALPDLRGRIPISQGQGTGLAVRAIGDAGGGETVTLQQAEMPAHSHPAQACSGAGTQASPENGIWAAFSNEYATKGSSVGNMLSSAIGNAGGSQPHDNVMPYLTLNFIIAFQGIWPDRP